MTSEQSPDMHRTEPAPSVTILPRPDGSLLVQGEVRVVDPEGREMEVKEKFSLCRCGASKNKPFCDASHREIAFSSARETDRPIDRYRAYEGEGITVEDNRTICGHLQYCIRELPTVFNRESRPWIDPDGAEPQEVADLVHRCPSGALVAWIAGERAGPVNLEPVIRIVEDGPYLVEGPVGLEIEDSLGPPVADRYTLCRCGASRNRPYCDGSHLALEPGWGELPERGV